MIQKFCSIDWTQLFGSKLKDDVERQWQFFKSSYTELKKIASDGNNIKCKYRPNKEIAVCQKETQALAKNYWMNGLNFSMLA